MAPTFVSFLLTCLGVTIYFLSPPELAFSNWLSFIGGYSFYCGVWWRRPQVCVTTRLDTDIRFIYQNAAFFLLWLAPQHL